MKFKIARLVSMLRHGSLRGHFSQYGEDVHLHKHFGRTRRDGFYVDIGAHHPFHLSNTAYLWMMGWRGMNVDASEATIASFERLRPADTNIHAAIVDAEAARAQDSIRFYFSKSIDNCATCDPNLAKERGMLQSQDVRCLSLAAVMAQAAQLSGGRVDLLNIDIEGLDEKVIADIGQWPVQPEVLMIEIYGQDIHDVVRSQACQTLEAAGYRFVERTGHTAVFHRRA